MSPARVALVTGGDAPHDDDDDTALLDALIWRGVDAALVPWDDRAVDWSAFTLAVIRSARDFAEREREFGRWMRRVERRTRLANPTELVEWNIDKRYLRDLATRGLPVVPTTWLEPGDLVRIPDRGEIVVQPVVYGGTIDEMRYRLPDHGEQARTQIEALLRDGRPVMVQPFLAEGGDHRDVRLVYIDGMLSHAVRPGPTTAAATAPASDVERAVGDRAIAAAADVGGPSLYAQVCLVGGIRGEPLVAELQLVAPKLYLSAAVGAPERFADAIARWADV